MWIVALILILAALLILLISRRQQRASGLPNLQVVYSDTRMWNRVEKPMYDPVIGLTGKPDYLVKEDGFLIPLEVKSSFAPTSPYPSHVYQLIAYCMLVWRTTQQRPPRGLIHYANRTFAIDFSPQMEQDFLALVEQIHHCDRSTNPARSHDSPSRCRRCGYREICDQKL